MRRFCCILLAACLASCNRQEADPSVANQSQARQADEARGGALLAAARAALSQSDFGTARALVDSIRRSAPLALNAREDAILLLDSVEFLSAQQALARTDSLVQGGDSISRRFGELMERVKFYHRKLDYDRSNRKQH